MVILTAKDDDVVSRHDVQSVCNNLVCWCDCYVVVDLLAN